MRQNSNMMETGSIFRFLLQALSTLKVRIVCAVSAVAVSACMLPCAGQDKGTWRASGNSATSVTGDITISGTKIRFDFLAFPLAQIRLLKPEEVSAIFDTDAGNSGSGFLYGLNVSAETRFLHKNTLCGSEDVHWMATYVSGRSLKAAFFSGTAAPSLSAEAMLNSSALCGTFSYTRF